MSSPHEVVRAHENSSNGFVHGSIRWAALTVMAGPGKPAHPRTSEPLLTVPPAGIEPATHGLACSFAHRAGSGGAPGQGVVVGHGRCFERRDRSWVRVHAEVCPSVA